MSDLLAKAQAVVDAHANRTVGADPYGEPEGFIQSPDQFLAKAGTVILCKDMADLLTRHYPGFNWAIQPSDFGGVFNIFCLDFSGRWGYRIRMVDIVHDPRRRAVVTAGGDILKRFGYPGHVYRPELMAQIKRNRKGEAIPDVSDLKKSRHTEAARLDKAIADGRATVIGKSPEGLDIVEVRGE